MSGEGWRSVEGGGPLPAAPQALEEAILHCKALLDQLPTAPGSTPLVQSVCVILETFVATTRS